MTYVVHFGRTSKSHAPDFATALTRALNLREAGWVVHSIVNPDRADDADDAGQRGQWGLTREEWERLEAVGLV